MKFKVSNNFKVGDKVQCINFEGNFFYDGVHLNEGKMRGITFTIREVGSFFNYPSLKLDPQPFENEAWWFDASRFIIVNEKPKVKKTEKDNGWGF